MRRPPFRWRSVCQSNCFIILSGGKSSGASRLGVFETQVIKVKAQSTHQSERTFVMILHHVKVIPHSVSSPQLISTTPLIWHWTSKRIYSMCVMTVAGFWSEVLKGHLNFVKGMECLQEPRWNVQALVADNDRPRCIYRVISLFLSFSGKGNCRVCLVLRSLSVHVTQKTLDPASECWVFVAVGGYRSILACCQLKPVRK